VWATPVDRRHWPDDHPLRIANMASIGIGDSTAWVMSGWAFRTVLGHLLPELDEAEDRAEVTQCLAIGGLGLNLMPVSQSKRIADVLQKVIKDMRAEILSVPNLPERDNEFAAALATLAIQLREITDA
jgi:hypothetical protein